MLRNILTAAYPFLVTSRGSAALGATILARQQLARPYCAFCRLEQVLDAEAEGELLSVAASWQILVFETGHELGDIVAACALP
jgi:hypothetical protein